MSDKKSQGKTRYRVKIDPRRLQEDVRKIAVTMMSAGCLGSVVQSDLVLLRDAVALCIIGGVLYIAVFIYPVKGKKGE